MAIDKKAGKDLCNSLACDYFCGSASCFESQRQQMVLQNNKQVSFSLATIGAKQSFLYALCTINLKLIQELLGHNDIKTTLRYTHVRNRTLENIKSPFDALNLKSE